ncbi:TetR/AcrR family transcriptional regulator [Amycolatopsis sp. H6(2020)]|nr:TetR/AcrR family transcriptional regulator [Amycolatopsis sp. H6(2020)]
MPLRERKKRRAQEAIVDAAFALFAERDFADVTVTEIAERAEVGRTTFFRYFGDKREVLFAEEQNLLAGLLAAPVPSSGRPSFREALDEARAAVAVMCRAVTADPERYRLHEKLTLAANVALACFRAGHATAGGDPAAPGQPKVTTSRPSEAKDHFIVPA